MGAAPYHPKRFEGITATTMLPMRLSFGALVRLAPAILERANLTILAVLPIGSAIIEEAGGLEAYDRKARSKSERLPVNDIVTTMKEAVQPELVEFKG